MDSHAKSSRLPLIEFNEKSLTPGTTSWKSTSDSVREALESYGCFVLAHHELGPDLQNRAFDFTKDLFRLPYETKSRHVSQLPGFGYGANFPVMPLFEYFGVEGCETPEGAKNFTNLMWPDDGHNKFCETIHSYSKLLWELNNAVVKMVASSYNLEKCYDRLTQSSIYMTRLMRYHAPGESKSHIGIIPHRDKSFMAVIGTNEVEGLQIETRDGNWIEYEPSPGKFVVIVGEALTAWSNGRIYCPLHKVIARGAKEKYSIGIFSFVGGTLQVPDELVDEENPLRFRAFSNLEFLNYCKEGGATMKGAIQAYCGI
ncbi:2-oxoglutarate (2OG) and Fe(II)-dependent oxygenase superfamily protein [Striga hermonthica]|uniref:2-oxoglutarate (2OG) and Fe(II)-dependent oxygenase superfamily protein n=1 Tax=Striga hermonthica TaxID=68872 RepID=A0A9N7NVP0_STRHE|nr:2-oxoglutarate (2OG) and Fe(II)-dependent oxygenase superfamily protein [Striga hermonthica]